MKAKITDVAQKANVSISTVSHVLNHTRFVSEETRKKVMDAVEELGYQPKYNYVDMLQDFKLEMERAGKEK